MKQCPQCQQQFTDSWISFCPNDGAVLRESQSYPSSSPPPVAEQHQNPGANDAARWMPQQPAGEQGWIAPDERPPMFPVWQPPPPPPYVRAPSQGLAIASMITAILGSVVGLFCLGPIPAIVALVLGLVALSQIKKSPERFGGKPFALVGVIVGSIGVLFYGAIFLYVILAAVLSR